MRARARALTGRSSMTLTLRCDLAEGNKFERHRKIKTSWQQRIPRTKGRNDNQRLLDVAAFDPWTSSFEGDEVSSEPKMSNKFSYCPS